MYKLQHGHDNNEKIIELTTEGNGRYSIYCIFSNTHTHTERNPILTGRILNRFSLLKVFIHASIQFCDWFNGFQLSKRTSGSRRSTLDIPEDLGPQQHFRGNLVSRQGVFNVDKYNSVGLIATPNCTRKVQR